MLLGARHGLPDLVHNLQCAGTQHMWLINSKGQIYWNGKTPPHACGKRRNQGKQPQQLSLSPAAPC
jgi:hypothetical protein